MNFFPKKNKICCTIIRQVRVGKIWCCLPTKSPQIRVRRVDFLLVYKRAKCNKIKKKKILIVFTYLWPSSQFVWKKQVLKAKYLCSILLKILMANWKFQVGNPKKLSSLKSEEGPTRDLVPVFHLGRKKFTFNSVLANKKTPSCTGHLK